VDAARSLPARWITKRYVHRDGKTTPLPDEEVPLFDRYLIRAVTEAFSGNHEEAVKLVRRARGAMGLPGSRWLPPEYAFIEILEALTAGTKHRAYLDAAIEYARNFQHIEPWASWAYAFEAKQAPDGPRRVRAAALALRLDPLSDRLQSIDARTRGHAEAWLERHNPFVRRKPAAGPAAAQRSSQRCRNTIAREYFEPSINCSLGVLGG